jgi:hypothetical protein
MAIPIERRRDVETQPLCSNPRNKIMLPLAGRESRPQMAARLFFYQQNNKGKLRTTQISSISAPSSLIPVTALQILTFFDGGEARRGIPYQSTLPSETGNPRLLRREIPPRITSYIPGVGFCDIPAFDSPKMWI